MNTLAGKTVLIIGGTSGMGFGVAKGSLLVQAKHVIVASSTPAKVDSAVKRLQDVIASSGLQAQATGHVLDASRIDNVKEFLVDVGKIDHLVFTAGRITRPVPGEQSALDAMEARLWVPVVAARTAQLNPGGSVTFTTGAGVVKPIKDLTIVASVLGAVDAATRGLAVDLAPIRVNTIAPGWVDTEIRDRMDPAQKKAILEAQAQKQLVKHIASADEMAEAYLFVMKCGYITGQSIYVDGGCNLV